MSKPLDLYFLTPIDTWWNSGENISTIVCTAQKSYQEAQRQKKQVNHTVLMDSSV